MQIRDFSRDEFLAHEAAFLEIAADVPGEYWTRRHFLADLPGKWRLSFVLWQEASPIGYAILSRPEEDHVHLHHFMIHADRRNRGGGGDMIEECLRRATADGAPRLTLKVAAANEPAQRFYRRHGFTETSSDGGYSHYERLLGRK